MGYSEGAGRPAPKRGRPGRTCGGRRRQLRLLMLYQVREKSGRGGRAIGILLGITAMAYRRGTIARLKQGPLPLTAQGAS